MNILMISHYAGGPKYGMEFRSYYMGREWVKMGHQVMIVGAAYSHLRKEQPLVGYEVREGINYLWLPTRTYEGNGAQRVLSMFEFVRQVYLHRQELVAFQPDMVIASSVYTFDIYPCKHIARRCGAKLVYEVHDLWPLSPMVIGGYSKWHPFIWLLQRGENYAYRHCDMVVSMLDKAFPHMERHGLTPNRFCCIPNGFLSEEWTDIDAISMPEEHSNCFAQLKSESKTIIGFAGGHTQSTAMNVLIEAAHQLKQREDLAFVLVGQGPQKEDLIALSQQYGLKNVHFLPPVKKECIPQVLKQFDICYAGGIHSMLHQYGTSFNKITDYMLSGKPIINSVDEPGSLIERVGCGIQVEAENTMRVCEAIKTITCMSPEERQAMGAKGQVYALEHLNLTTLSQQFIEKVCQ